MPAAVRLGDKCAGHCFEPRGNVGASPNVFINGIAVHRVGDPWPVHSCGTSRHDSVQAVGSPNVFINNRAVARVGDAQTCGSVDAVGSPNVFING